jgi:hypothetical protein
VGTPDQSISGATSASYTPPAYATAGVFNYYVTIGFDGNGCNALMSSLAQINVVTDPIVTAEPISASYCQFSTTVSPLLVAASGGTGTFSYQWYTNSTNTNTGGTIIGGATSASYLPSVNSTGTTYYYCVVNQTGTNCSVTSQTAMVNVNLQATITSTNFSTQTVCVGGTLTQLSVSYINGTGTPSYQWYSNTNNNTSSGTPITGETGFAFTPPSSISGTTYYYCIITFSSGGCGDVTSDIATIIIQPDPVISLQPLVTQTICGGGTIPSPLTIAYTGGTGTPTYQWYIDGSPSQPIPGATSTSFIPTDYTSSGTYTYYATVSLTGNGCNTATSGMAQIIVIDDPVADVQPLTSAYCQNSSTTNPLSVSANGGTGSYTYQWYNNNTNSNQNGLVIAGANSSTYVPPTSSIGTTYYYCVVDQGGSNCSATSNAVSVQVSLQPSITSQPIANQTICSGGTLSTLSVSVVNGVPGPTYQWHVNSVSSTSGGQVISGATSSSYQPQNQTPGNYYYYCVVIYPLSSCNQLITSISQIQIFQDPSFTLQPTNGLEVCSNAVLSTDLSSAITGGTGSYSVQWYTISNNVLNNISGATQLTYNPTPITVSGTYDYFVNVTYVTNGCGFINSDTVSLIVNPLPNLEALPDITVCNEGTFTVNLSADVNSNFVWSAANNASVSGEVFIPQTSAVISNTLTNNTSTHQQILYTITPT